MPDAFTSDKTSALKMADGENENTWGQRLNDESLTPLALAVAGYQAKSVAGGSDVTLTATEAQYGLTKFTGTLTANINVIVPAASGEYTVHNATSGAYTLTVKTSAGTGITVTQGEKARLYCDGTDVLKLVATDDFLANVAEDTSPQLGGPLDPNSNYIGWAKGGDIASASPLVIGTDGNYFDVTGTTGFSAMTVAANRLFMLQFDGILTMTHGGSLNLPGGANITTAAGDECICFATATDTVRVVSYTRGDGTALAGTPGATGAEKANILLNSFRIAINGGLSVQNMVDGFVDEFEDETGVDTGASSNELYDAVGDYYTNRAADTTEDGGLTAGGTSADGSTHFDRSWAVNNSETVNKISMYTTVAATVKLKIGLENSATDIDIVYDESFSHGGTGWETFTLATPYDVPASGTYRLGVYSASVYSGETGSNARSYYIGDAVGSTEVYTSSTIVYGILRAHYQGAVADMTLLSNAVMALAQPDGVFLVLWTEDIDTVTLNTDILVYASRDGGTTWTQGTLVKEATLGTGQILTATIDVSGQPAGTSMKWKVVTANTKELRAHAVAEQWS